MGRYDEARKITEEAGALYPDQARFPSRLAQISVCQGMYGQALEEIERALALDSTILPFATLLRAEIKLLKDDFAGVEEELQNFGESSSGRRYGIVLLSLSQGKLKELRRLVELQPVMEEFLVFLDLFTGHADRALEMLKELLTGMAEDRRFYDGIRVRHAIGIAYVFMGDLDSALKMAEELRRFIESTMNRKVIRFYHHLMGTIEMERRNYNRAIQSFEEAIALLPSPVEQQGYYHPWFFDSLAQAYFRKGDLDKALAEYEKISALTLHRLEAGNFYAGSFYWQGKIDQQKGQKKKALEKYTKFLELWKDADPDIPEVQDARTQLASVK
jgi:tetratricopeptide (TPR) repeat protein